jgi:hypothetical protein
VVSSRSTLFAQSTSQYRRNDQLRYANTAPRWLDPKILQPHDAWVPLSENQLDAYLRGGSAAVDWRDVAHECGAGGFNP